MLFGVLNAQIFTVFSGPNRHLYEAVVGENYSSWYRNDLLLPADAEIVGQIYHLLGERPELWREKDGPVQLDSVKVRPGRRLKRRGQAAADVDATSVAMARSRYIYNRLNETGCPPGVRDWCAGPRTRGDSALRTDRPARVGAQPSSPSTGGPQAMSISMTPARIATP